MHMVHFCVQIEPEQYFVSDCCLTLQLCFLETLHKSFCLSICYWVILSTTQVFHSILFFNSTDVSCGPLSETSCSGIPHLANISETSLIVHSVAVFFNITTSGHFECASTTIGNKQCFQYTYVERCCFRLTRFILQRQTR